MFREYEAQQRIFDLPAASFVRGDRVHDCTVRFHGRAVAAPFGPAAGPHTQLAQNIVLSWLAGGRIIELKTIQANDRIRVARPCIDVRSVGFNVEWSQELTLEQSLEEYVKASMLIQMLVASGIVAMTAGFDRFLFDASVGYDYAGITSDRVQAFLRGLTDAKPTIDRLRREIPARWRTLSELDFDRSVASSVTLSTFHGCPPDEIERILRFLITELQLPAVVKLNPTLLGYDATRRLLHDVLGYHTIGLNRDAFERDLPWGAACDLVDRVGHVAAAEGRGFGVKLTNTLVVENDGVDLPSSEPAKYLSGAPLHVLAMHLVRSMRREFGSRLPISFSGGIDRLNYADAVALGLTPVTVCTDLLRSGGYARAHAYFDALVQRMEAVGASTVDEFIGRAYHGAGNAGDAIVANTERYVESLAATDRYAAAANSRPPRKIGRGLRLFDCLACDKCVAACPNDANFTFALPPGEIRREVVWHEHGRWWSRADDPIVIAAPRQFGNFADLCNDCGNCDVLCPEDGGPYRAKPRFFGSADAWRAAAPDDGFFVDPEPSCGVVLARIDGADYGATFCDGRVTFVGPAFTIEFDEQSPASTVEGRGAGEIDLTLFHVMRALRQAVCATPGTNFVNSLTCEER